MKTLKFIPRISYVLVAGLLLCLSTFFSCEKETITTQTALPETNDVVGMRTIGDGVIDYTLAENILNNINYNEILVNDDLGALDFPSATSLSNTLSLLEEASQVLADEISNSLTGLGADEIEYMDINEDYAFESFENNFPNFNSLRAMIAEQEEEFFDNEELNDEDDPTDVHDAIPTVLRAVMNTFGEVVFQGEIEPISQIHISRPDGGNYTITDGDIAIAFQIRTGLPHNQIAMKNAVNIDDVPNDDGGGGGGSGGAGVQCDDSRVVKKTEYNTYGNQTSRAKLKIGVRNSSFWGIHRAYSELNVREKKGNGRYKKIHAGISIDQLGEVYTSNAGFECVGDALDASAYDYKVATKLEVRKDFSQKISASNKNNPSDFLQADFAWLNYTFNLKTY